jgi:hypothetical protein
MRDTIVGGRDMRLVACAEPQGPLEEAPASELLVAALLPDERTGASAGFWARDDRYYARVVREDGGVRWLTFAEPEAVAAVGDDTRRSSAVPATRRVALVGRANAGPVLVLPARPRRRG